MNTQQIIELLETLPISVYTQTGKKFTRFYDKQSFGTFINFLNDSITIGLRIFERLKNVNESSVRALFYHEVSHAILTNTEITKANAYSASDIAKHTNANADLTINELNQLLNIIEDQRIETILANYYLHVDFAKFVKQVHDSNDQPSEKALSKFWVATRIPSNEKWSVKIHKALQGLLKSNVTTNDYAKVIAIYCEMKENSNEQLNEKQSERQDGQQGEQQGEQPQLNEKQSERQDGQQDEQQGEQPQLTEEDVKDIVTNSVAQQIEKQHSHQKALQREHVRKDLVSTLNIETLINKLILKSKSKAMVTKNLGLTQSYSPGKLNIHRVANLKNYNYKMFDNKGRTNNSKQAITINFYIDNSGSFIGNAEAVNGLLKQLLQLEKKLKGAFKFNLTTINDGNEIQLTGDNRQIDPDGGTHISWRLEDIFKSQQSQAIANILLLDGYASIYGNLRYLDTRHTYLLVDDSNQNHFQGFAKANLDLVRDNEYVEKFEKFIVSSLSKLLYQI